MTYAYRATSRKKIRPAEMVAWIREARDYLAKLAKQGEDDSRTYERGLAYRLDRIAETLASRPKRETDK
jgi:hypothetical protein